MSSLPQLDDPTDFHSPLLQQLDSSLRCQICHELFTAPVILTNCSHTFDSLCLRNHFKLSKKCPQCQVEANEDRIRRNLVVEEMVNNWVKARYMHYLDLSLLSPDSKLTRAKERVKTRFNRTSTNSIPLYFFFFSSRIDPPISRPNSFNFSFPSPSSYVHLETFLKTSPSLSSLKTSSDSSSSDIVGRGGREFGCRSNR